MLSAMDYAEYIIDYCTQNNKPITNLQLQKVLYYIQLNNIRNVYKPAFEDSIEAWPYGPVVRGVYERFNSYGSTRICRIYEDSRVKVQQYDQELVNQVINACVSLEPWELVRRSHNQGGPWERVYTPYDKVVIPLEYITEYALKK